jgi:hypothetical protein
MTKNDEARERWSRSRANLQNAEFSDAYKISREPAQSQQLFDAPTRCRRCTRCSRATLSLQLFAVVAHPSLPAVIKRFCVCCASAKENDGIRSSGGAIPRCAQTDQSLMLNRRGLLRYQAVKLMARGITIRSWLWRALYETAEAFEQLSERKEEVA